MRLQTVNAAVDNVLQELESMGEFESESTGTSYFYVDAFRIMPDGSYQPLESWEPQMVTQDYAMSIMTGMCVKWANNNPTWRVGIRCLQWSGGRWIRSGTWNPIPCQNLG